MQTKSFNFLVLPFLIFPLILGAQNLLGQTFHVFFIYLRLIFIPLLVLFMLKRTKQNLYMAALTAMIFLTSYSYNPNYYGFFISFFSIISLIIMFSFGVEIGNKSENHSCWLWLRLGVLVLNIFTFLIFFLIKTQVIDESIIADLIDKNNDYDQGFLLRFSLGNSIELPFLMTMALYLSLMKSSSNCVRGLSLTLNLFTSILSGSRLVIIMNLLIFLREYFDSKTLRFKNMITLLTLILGWILVDPGGIMSQFLLIQARFLGYDGGSLADRFSYLIVSLDYIENLYYMILGHGLNESTQLIYRVFNEKRSTESVLLQIIFDLGVIGVFLIFKSLKPFKVDFGPGIIDKFIVGLFWAQFLIFLPLSSISQLLGFCLGALSKTKKRLSSL
jgi:hypothetical protein